jgi:N-acetylneuraminic acid mutarotase
MYDPSLNTWTTLTAMPTPRWALAADVVNGKILAVGGWNSTVAFTTCEEYDPSTNSWSAKPSFTARAGLVACAVGNMI